MYETIYKALVEVGLEDAFSPQDYLNFYCLGNREAVNPNEPPNTEAPGTANTPQVSLIILFTRITFIHCKISLSDRTQTHMFILKQY